MKTKNNLFYSSSEGPKLTYNEKTDDGEVKFPKDWKRSSAVWRADCLHDWITKLQIEYERAVREVGED